MEVLADADKARIVVIAILDMRINGDKLYKSAHCGAAIAATPGSSLAATSWAARAVLSKERNSTPSNFSKK